MNRQQNAVTRTFKRYELKSSFLLTSLWGCFHPSTDWLNIYVFSLCELDNDFVLAQHFESCLPSNAYYPRTPDYTLYSGVGLLFWTFWFVIRLRMYEFGLWLRYHDRNYSLTPFLSFRILFSYNLYMKQTFFLPPSEVFQEKSWSFVIGLGRLVF